MWIDCYFSVSPKPNKLAVDKNITLVMYFNIQFKIKLYEAYFRKKKLKKF